MGDQLSSALRHIGKLAILIGDTVRFTFRRPFGFDLLMAQLYHLGVRSLSITTITALFTGMVLALQTAHTLGIYGAKLLIGDAVSLSIVRELGPVLTSLLVAGRVGAGITAEIGSMAVTEQVDAIRALGASPVKKLVVPKVLATIIMLPLLTILADFIGIFGGLIISVKDLDQSSAYYIQHVITALTFDDIFSGVGKTFFFAAFIAVIGCYNGLNATGGADGVGRATTGTVVVASIMILISNFFLTKMFLLL
ncbi:MAG TPA: ABC transporter permease [Patescibacteria group bacterium]|jgi:phospholipid/cholesterol/gamma-HCH transport system permease protein|nr:ABC transporter permease [Patescibacteria group bacterium]